MLYFYKMQIALVLTLAFVTAVSCATVIPAVAPLTDCNVLATIFQKKLNYSTSMDNYLLNIGGYSIWNVTTEPNGCCNFQKYSFAHCDASNRITDLYV